MGLKKEHGPIENVPRLKLHEAEPDAEILFYRACGLDYVYLVNGFRTETTPYGSGASIQDIQSLHKAISVHLVLRRRNLGPGEFRFLRFEMHMTQEQIASAFGVTVQTVARYEKGKTDIPGPTERLMRVLYVFKCVRREDWLAWMEQIHRMLSHEAGADGAAIFKLTPAGWLQANSDHEENSIPTAGQPGGSRGWS